MQKWKFKKTIDSEINHPLQIGGKEYIILVFV